MAAWAAALGGLLLLTATLFLWGDREKVTKVAEGLKEALLHVSPLDLLLGLALLVAWAAAASGIMASVVLSGRNWLVGLFAVAPTVLVAITVSAERIAGVDAWRSILPIAALLGVALLPLATALFSWLAWRRGHLAPWALLFGGAVWAALSLALVLRFPSLRATFSTGELPLERALAGVAPASLSGLVLPLGWRR